MHAAYLSCFQMYRWEMLFSRGTLLITGTVSLSLPLLQTSSTLSFPLILTHFPTLPQVPLHFSMTPISLTVHIVKEKLSRFLHFNSSIKLQLI